MAKTRAKTSKSSKTSIRRASVLHKPRKPKKIALKPAYRELKSSLSELKRAPQTKDVKFAVTRLMRCMNEIDDICGPDMIIIIEPR